MMLWYLGEQFAAATFEDSNVVYVEGCLRLRKQDGTGAYDPGGTYYTGTVVLGNLTGTAIESVHSFSEDATISTFTNALDPVTSKVIFGRVDYQISVDDGTTWLYYNTTASPPAWQTATLSPPTYSLATEIEQGLPTLTYTLKRQLKVRVRLQPGDGDVVVSNGAYTPSLAGLGLGFEVNITMGEDLERSLLRFLKDNLTVTGVEQTILDQPTTKVTIRAASAATPVVVYNLTDDPGRLTNLFATYNSGTKVVTMSSQQSLNDKIEVRFTIPVEISMFDEARIEESITPQVLVSVVGDNDEWWQTGGQPDDIEVVLGLNVAKKRPTGQRKRVSVQFSCYAARERDVQEIHGKLRTLFQRVPVFTSVGTGRFYELLPTTIQSIQDQVSEGVAGRILTGEIMAEEFMPSVATTEIGLIQQINVSTSNMAGDFNETLAVTGA